MLCAQPEQIFASITLLDCSLSNNLSTIPRSTPYYTRCRSQLHSQSTHQPIAFLFFFSSRRRHTRLVSDWSSDVCSSDLKRSSTRTRMGNTMGPFSQDP